MQSCGHRTFRDYVSYEVLQHRCGFLVMRVPEEVIEVLLTSPSFAIGAERVFLNKHGGPLDANQWASDYWPRVLKGLGIRHGKFYCTRHTFNTEQVKRGELLKAIENYCWTLTLSGLTVFKPGASKLSKSMAVSTGFEDYLTPENIRASPALALLTRLS